MTQMTRLADIIKLFDETSCSQKLLTKHDNNYLPIYSIQAFEEANKPLHLGVIYNQQHVLLTYCDPLYYQALLCRGEVPDDVCQGAGGRDGAAEQDGRGVDQRAGRQAAHREQVRGGGRSLPPPARRDSRPEHGQQSGKNAEGGCQGLISHSDEYCRIVGTLSTRAGSSLISIRLH